MADEKLNLEITINTKQGEQAIDNLDGKTKQAAKSAKEGQGAFSSLGNTIKSLGVITLIAGAFNFFKETLSKNQKVVNAVSAVMGTLSTIINKLVDIFIDVTDEVGKSSNGFDALGKVLMGILTLGVTPLKLAFDAIKFTIQQVQLAWEKSPFGDKDQNVIKELTKDIEATKKSLSDTGTSAVNAGKDIVNNFGEAASSVSKVITGVVDKVSKVNVKAIYQSEKALIALKNTAAISQAVAEGLVEKYDRQAEKLRQIRDDEFKSIDVRIQANNDLKLVLDKQEEQLKRSALLGVEVARQELARDKTNLDAKVALIAAQNKVLAVEAQIEGLRSEQAVNQTALSKERLAINASLAASNNKLTLDERKANADLIKDDILKLETKKQIAKEESELELKRLQDNINNSVAGTQARADAEIAYNEKALEIRNQFATINSELDIAIKDKENEARNEKIALLQADYELEKALGNARFEDQVLVYDQTRELERRGIEARKHTAAELEAFDKQTAKGRIDIARAVEDQKLDIINQAMNVAMEIVGKESAAGKALAISQAVMNTYVGATRALKDVPYPFNFVAAATTIASGFMSVKKIMATQVPGAPTGGSVPSASSMAAPIAPSLSQAAPTTLSQGTINDIGNQAIKTYVVESDMTSNQQRIAAIQQRARFS